MALHELLPLVERKRVPVALRFARLRHRIEAHDREVVGEPRMEPRLQVRRDALPKRLHLRGEVGRRRIDLLLLDQRPRPVGVARDVLARLRDREECVDGIETRAERRPLQLLRELLVTAEVGVDGHQTDVALANEGERHELQPFLGERSGEPGAYLADPRRALHVGERAPPRAVDAVEPVRDRPAAGGDERVGHGGDCRSRGPERQFAPCDAPARVASVSASPRPRPRAAGARAASS